MAANTRGVHAGHPHPPFPRASLKYCGALGAGQAGAVTAVSSLEDPPFRRGRGGEGAGRHGKLNEIWLHSQTTKPIPRVSTQRVGRG